MSGTLIERNTVELQEILDEVKNLPSASSGSNIIIYKIAMGSTWDITADDLEGATKIVPYAFANTKHGSVTIPDSVKVIGDMAFFISQMQTLDLGNGVEEIQVGAFEDSLMGSSEEEPMYVNIPSSVKRIGSNAFFGAHLVTFTFKGKPEYISPYAFDDAYMCTINVPWSEGEVANEPWGGDVEINYNYTEG